mgnify:CR=1 FL=1
MKATDGFPHTNFSSQFGVYNNSRKTNAEFGFRCHDLRHEFAITWQRNGRDICELSCHLAHSSAKTEEIYLGYVGTNPGTAMTVLPRL